MKLNGLSNEQLTAERYQAFVSIGSLRQRTYNNFDDDSLTDTGAAGSEPHLARNGKN